MKKLVSLLVMVAVLAAMVSVSFGTAASSAVDTPRKAGITAQFGVATNTRIWAGTIVALNSSGYAVPAADSSGYVVVGRAAKTVDNRTGQAGAGDNGALKIDVERGVFGWASSTITSATSVGSLCYVADDNTVTSSGGSYNIIAGTVVDYSDSKVWVDTFNIGRTAGSYTTLAASGAVALSDTLAVTGVATFTAESVHNGGIDTDYVTVDAGYGVDTKTAGTLKLGETTANKVEISVAGVETEVQGTLDVIQAADFDAAVTMGSTLGVTGATTLNTLSVTGATTSVSGTLAVTGQATFTAIPKFSAALATAADVTVTLTNAPTSTTTVPIWIKVVNGTTTYVVPAYAQP